MINEEVLLNNGYKQYVIPAFEKCDKFYQKKINGEYINVYYYNFKVNEVLNYAYEFKSSKEKDRFWKTIHLYALDEDITLEEIEKELLGG